MPVPVRPGSGRQIHHRSYCCRQGLPLHRTSDALSDHPKDEERWEYEHGYPSSRLVSTIRRCASEGFSVTDHSVSRCDDGQPSWRSRVNVMRRTRAVQARRMRQAVVRRLVERDLGPDTEDIAQVVLRAWETIETRLPRVAQTLDLHHVSGYSIDEVAALLGHSHRTSAVDLRLGHAWLVRDLRLAFARQGSQTRDRQRSGVQPMTLAGH